MSNKVIIPLAAVLAVVVLVFHVYAKKSISEEDTDSLFDSFKKPVEWQGRISPDFEVELLSGETFRFSDVVGKKVVVLNFFATWCGPCKTELPELNTYYEKHKDEPFSIIGINDGESEDKVKKFISENSVRFPVAIDKNGTVKKLFAVTGFPTTVFIGIDGNVHIYEIGPVLNTDISFDAAYKANSSLFRNGKGISKEAYLLNLSEQKKAGSPSVKDTGENHGLSGKAKEIADKMYCPCGCEHMLINCTCKTAKQIREKLRTGDFSGKTDDEIIKELNKEFCVRDKKDKHDQS